MIGAIIGDIVGSPYEFANIDTKDFPLFGNGCSFTDDTICTIAIADALSNAGDFGESLRKWGHKYPNPKGAFGGSYSRWLRTPDAPPYNSWGNGAAMRVSPVGWAFDDEATTIRAALASAAPTHNHEEGLIGAMCVARAIFALRRMERPAIIPDMVAPFYGVDWEGNLPGRGVFDESCKGCVPLAFSICANAADFEDAIRSAVAYGGDSDTLAAIVGSLAEARFGIPQEIKDKALSFLPRDMIEVIEDFKISFWYE